MANLSSEHSGCYWKDEVKYSRQACITMRAEKMRYNYTCEAAYIFSRIEVVFHRAFLNMLILTVSSAFVVRAAGGKAPPAADAMPATEQFLSQHWKIYQDA